jgi:hypothetical protein
MVETHMFGGLVFLVHGNIAVGIWDDSLIARLGEERAKEALLEPHVSDFDVTGRPMRGWIMVEPDGLESDSRLQEWIQRALDFALTLPAK